MFLHESSKCNTFALRLVKKLVCNMMKYVLLCEKDLIGITMKE